MEKETVSNIDEALSSLRVTESTLTAEEKKFMDDNGYLTLSGILNEHQIERLRNKYEELMEREGDNAGKEVHQEKGTRRLSDLVNKGEVFDIMYTHPKVLAVIFHVIGREFKLSSLNARDVIPGEGLQGLHADWGPRKAGDLFHVCNSIWLIDDFTEENGATRVVPGTHKLEGGPANYMIDTTAPHPDEVKIIAPAGTVCVFNSHTWHGGTVNRSNKTRRACHSYFTAREHRQQLNQLEYIRKITYDRIVPAAKYILDIN